MKTSEFVKIANELGYKTLTNKEMVAVKEPHTLSTVLRISNKTELSLDTQFGHSALNKHKLESLIVSAVDLARTAIEDREEMKKYRYQLPKSFGGGILTLDLQEEIYFFSPKTKENYIGDRRYQMFKKYFTDKEVEAYPEDIQALFKACKKELVE